MFYGRTTDIPETDLAQTDETDLAQTDFAELDPDYTTAFGSSCDEDIEAGVCPAKKQKLCSDEEWETANFSTDSDEDILFDHRCSEE